ncbi:DUF952 domain-containing protein [Flectobacillus major]|uniref:DUF952 domain-containing protein n=1 Tax=Flectobacillus major TaxID=103 RepID=UPI0004243802|nr:DUF952 domain-containing protein [Flectobacillus major]
MKLVHHLVLPDWWATFDSKDYYESETLSVEQFIHFSMPEQVEGTLNRYFVGTPSILLLHIDADLLTAPLVFESAGNHGVFPHLYGRLNKSAIIGIDELKPNVQGYFTFNTSS